jgi:glycosyltransferase involved in cell wall biosynthesis
MKQLLLSVCIITYNHEKYIRDAIEGVLMQKVNFSYEIIIADDYSTDNTRKIILEYKEKYPELFKLVFQIKNVGPAQNWLDLLSMSKSNYIAYFEGDDFWIDEFKLQKQIDFLEGNIDYGLTYTNSAILQNNKILDNKLGSNLLKTNLFEANCIPTLTVMFRTNHFHSFFSTFNLELKEWIIGDYPFWLWIYCNSKIHYIDCVTSVHRVVEGSASNSGNRFLIKFEAFKISNFFLKKYNLDEPLKVYIFKRFSLILTCLNNKPSSIFIVLKLIF